MMALRGDYSVIQFCPDPARFEAANVGVALLCVDGGYVGAEVSRDNARPRGFFGRHAFDNARLNLSKRVLADQIRGATFQTRDAFEHFCAMRANRLRMTPPQFCRVEGDPDAVLRDLFAKIVGGAPVREPVPKFPDLVGREFARFGLLGERVLTEVPVRVPVFRREKLFPYAWKNGTGKLVRPVRFRGLPPERVEQRASLLAVEGRSVGRVEVPRLGRCELHVIGQFAGGDTATRETVKSILAEDGVALFEAEELGGYVQTVRAEGRVLAGDEAEVRVGREEHGV